MRITKSKRWQDVPPFHVVAGNPARVIRRIITKMDSEQRAGPDDDKHIVSAQRADEPLTKLAQKPEEVS